MKKPSPFNFSAPARRKQGIFISGSGLDEAQAWVGAVLPADREHNNPLERVFNKRALFWLAALAAAAFLVLGLRLGALQLLEGEHYLALAEGNRVSEQVIYAPRGNIYDRNGTLLAGNTASFQLVVYPNLLAPGAETRAGHYHALASSLGVTADELRLAAEAEGLEYAQPLIVETDIAYERALQIERRLPEVAGFKLSEVPIRIYRDDAALAHILGFVAQASEADREASPDLFVLDYVGQEGIEQQYDALLRGEHGFHRTEVDALGQPLRDIGFGAPTPGQDIHLTIDYELQKALKSALKRQMARANVNRAAAVALDPTSGAVLASVSLPDYDNNLFARGISVAEYERLINDPREPLYNKVIGGTYPTGSTIKPLHAGAALEEGVVDEDTIIHDRGSLTLRSPYGGSFTFMGWDPSGLGPMDVRRAIAMSSNIYFFTTGGGFEDFRGLGAERLTDYYQQYGLGARTGIDLPGEASGRVPTPEWKEAAMGEPWFQGDTYNISIGQGDLLVTPLQMAVATAAIANNGQVLKPYLLKDTVAPEVVRRLPIKRSHLRVVQEGMAQVIGGTTATATFQNVGVRVAGKSGTAETDTPGARRAHAWYTAYAPYEHPEILFAAILEEGEGGSQFVAPAIAEAMERFFIR